MSLDFLVFVLLVLVLLIGFLVIVLLVVSVASDVGWYQICWQLL